ncbi:paraquat-inducible protein B [Pseudomonas citronellolis]|uniref:Paraquat-inducible protein B n=1 Tax=Pseudomonas citronellolis TaxID=53408 RepID=A0AAQ1KGW2_9PSED|nr:MlaD family protein [Pseudomonas citronellolis]TGC22134.1 MCE family protein [Pseudomonas citronellolis]SFD31067.1 paraquat-inducible protein B [Pseudomonas citronellolis]
MAQDTHDPASPGQAEVRTRRWNLSLVWIVPIVALLVGASLVVRNWMQQGPVIAISFATGEGLEVHKTQVKYRSVVIGEVTSVELARDRKGVVTKVQLSKEAESFASRGAQFWVVRPRIGAGGVSGVDTLLSGAFIGADAGESSAPEKNFTGLESPPPITYGEKGKRFMLTADDLGSLDIGSSIYYRRIPVGQVVSYALRQDGKGVDIGVFVNAPYDAFVTQDTRFWNASGVDLSVDANGLKVNTESLSSLLMGGLAFGNPPFAANAEAAADQQRFRLFADRDSALAPPSGIAQHLRFRFDQSMRGLSVGAPVEFMGVAFGKVTSVQLDYDEAKQSFPVMVDAVVYPARLGPVHQKMLKAFGQTAGEEAASRLIGTFVEHGLRAQARSGNLITGQMYVSLDFYPDAKKVAFDAAAQPIAIPTVPGSLDKLQEQLQEVVERIRKLPLERIAGNLDGSLRELQGSLKQFNQQTLPGVKGTLDDVRKTLQTANAALAKDSPQREKLGDTLDELERMSRSLRDLSDYLGRHPESLIRGRPKAANANDLQP